MPCITLLGGQQSVALRRPLGNDKEVDSNPAATRNVNTDFGQTPAQKAPR